MTQELNNQLASLIGVAKDGMLKAVEIVYQQAPELVEQLLRWRMWECILNMLFECLFFIVSYICFRYLRKYCKKQESDEAGLLILAIIASLVLGLIFLSDVYTLIQILIAPKIFVLEYLTKLVGG